RERFTVGAEDFHVLGDLHHAVLAVGVDVEDALVRVNFLDDARDFEAERAGSAQHQRERRRQKRTPHGCPPSSWCRRAACTTGQLSDANRRGKGTVEVEGIDFLRGGKSPAEESEPCPLRDRGCASSDRATST